jgi:cytochrome c
VPHFALDQGAPPAKRDYLHLAAMGRRGQSTGGISMNRIMASLLFAGSSLGVVPAHAQDVDTLQKGKAMAEQVCSECHAIRKGEARSPNTLAPAFEKVAMTPGMTSIALTAALRTSHRAMPNIILSDDELRGVIAYITSLK